MALLISIDISSITVHGYICSFDILKLIHLYVTCAHTHIDVEIARFKSYAIYDTLCFNFFVALAVVSHYALYVPRTNRYFSGTKHRYICRYIHVSLWALHNNVWYFVTRKARRTLQIFSFERERKRERDLYSRNIRKIL